MEELVYLNGDLIPRSRARLSAFDHGFLYGYGLFETMRSYNGSIFLLDRHLARLHGAADTLGLTPRLAPIDLKEACCAVLKANKLKDARLRLTVSAGEGDMVPNPATCAGITVFIVAQKLLPPPLETCERGFKTILSTIRRNSQSPLSRLKSSCYLENVLARQEARLAGADEALILNEKGLLAEGSSCNIFLVKKQTLLTPSIESGVLPGITREVILELARTSGIEAVEKGIELDELLEADEAFLTNSIIEIMPLTQLDDKPIGSGKPEITRQLISAYGKLIPAHTAD